MHVVYSQDLLWLTILSSPRRLLVNLEIMEDGIMYIGDRATVMCVFAVNECCYSHLAFLVKISLHGCTIDNMRDWAVVSLNSAV